MCRCRAGNSKHLPGSEAHMRSHPDGSLSIQTSSEFVPSTPAWFGEIAMIAQYGSRTSACLR